MVSFSDAAVAGCVSITCCEGGEDGVVTQNSTACNTITDLKWKAVSVRSHHMHLSVCFCLTVNSYINANQRLDSWSSLNLSTACGLDSCLALTFVLFPLHLKARMLPRTSHPPPMCLLCSHALTDYKTD